MTQKQRLVVIGNGMAGARFVEEMLARRGRERFDLVVFGDEPSGNYNRERHKRGMSWHMRRGRAQCSS